MHPEHRYLILSKGQPVHTAEDLVGVVAYLWGEDINNAYVVYDYECPWPVDTPDLAAWKARIKRGQKGRDDGVL